MKPTQEKTWEENLIEKAGITAISSKTGITYQAFEREETIKFINSLLQEQRENCAKTYNDCCIGAGDIPKPYFADRIENSPKPIGEKRG